VYKQLNINEFAADHSLSPGTVSTVAKAGSVVIFNCTLNTDNDCTNQSIVWNHYSAFRAKEELWYKKSRYNSILNSSNVTVKEDSAHGWSVLNIPKVRLENRGRFRCDMISHSQCHVDFLLIVTGKFSKFSKLSPNMLWSVNELYIGLYGKSQSRIWDI